MARKAAAEAPTPMPAEVFDALVSSQSSAIMKTLADTTFTPPAMPIFQTHEGEHESLFDVIEHAAEFGGEISHYGLSLAEREAHVLAMKGANLFVNIVSLEQNPQGEAHKVLDHVLMAWESEQKFQTDKRVYEQFHIGRRPRRPHHFLKKLPAELAEAYGFRFIEDHFGNFIHPKISTHQKVNEAIEGVIDGGIIMAGNIAMERLARSTQEYIVMAAAKKLPEAVQPYVESSVAYAALKYDSARVQAGSKGRRKR